MAAKTHKAEGIVTKLRQVDALNAQGKSMAEVSRWIGVTEVTYDRWRSRHQSAGRRGLVFDPHQEMAMLRNLTLLSGIPVEVFVKTGDRTVMSYVLKPLSDQLARAMNEE